MTCPQIQHNYAADLRPDARRYKARRCDSSMKTAVDYVPRRAAVLVTEALADTRVVIICEGKSMRRRRVLVLVAGAAAVWGAGPVAVPGTAVAWAVPAARGAVPAAGSWGR